MIKRICTILFAFAISACAFSQDNWIGVLKGILKGDADNYKRIYVGYTPTAGDDNYTLEIGWTKGINVVNHKLPIFLEVGAELQGAILETMQYNLGSNESSDDSHYPIAVNIPLHATYRFAYKDFTASPFIGANFNVGVYDFDAPHNVEMYKDYADRFTAGFNIGINLTYKKLFVGVRGTVSDESSYSNLYLGLQFK